MSNPTDATPGATGAASAVCAAGLCQCGCGQPTRLSARNDSRRGIRKGEPRKFLKGHHHRHRGVPPCGYIPDPDTGCWQWMLAGNRKGYGMLGGRLAHSVIWEQNHGPLPEGQHLDHLCRNRRCVNPAHLEPVTPAVNTQRGLNTNLTPEDVAAIRSDTRLQREIAADFGITQTTVSKIKRSATWRNS